MSISDKTLQQIGDNVKNARLKANMTQVELAEKSGISTNYISRIERADTMFTVDYLERLCKALNIKSSKILPF